MNSMDVGKSRVYSDYLLIQGFGMGSVYALLSYDKATGRTDCPSSPLLSIKTAIPL